MSKLPVVVGLSLLSLAGCMEQGFSSSPPDVTASTPVASGPAIRIAPAAHDFGAPAIGCKKKKSFDIHNDGDADLVVDAIDFEADSDEFVFENPNELPVTIAPGESVEVDLTYLGVDDIEDYSGFVAASNDPVNPEATAEARGGAVSLGRVVETFEQPTQPKSDILVVIDNSGSMGEEQNSLTTNFQSFVNAIIAAGADWRLAVITTDNANFQGAVITPTTADPIAAFAQQASVGTNGSGEEKPMEMAFRATEPGNDAAPGGAFFRDDALLSVVVVTDEPDDYSPMTPTQLVDYFVDLKGGDASLFKFHTIGGDVPSPACFSAAQASVPLDEVSALSGGLFQSVCVDWGNSLTAVALGSVQLIEAYALGEEPYTPSLEVTVDGAEASTGWSYDAATQSVVFDADAVPPEGAEVVISYEPLADCG